MMMMTVMCRSHHLISQKLQRNKAWLGMKSKYRIRLVFKRWDRKTYWMSALFVLWILLLPLPLCIQLQSRTISYFSWWISRWYFLSLIVHPTIDYDDETYPINLFVWIFVFNQLTLFFMLVVIRKSINW